MCYHSNVMNSHVACTDNVRALEAHTPVAPCVGRARKVATPSHMRRRALGGPAFPIWSSMYGMLRNDVLQDGSMTPGKHARQLASTEHQAALLFLVSSATAVLLRAASSFFMNVMHSYIFRMVCLWCGELTAVKCARNHRNGLGAIAPPSPSAHIQRTFAPLFCFQNQFTNICVVLVALVYLASVGLYWMLHIVTDGPQAHWTVTWAGTLSYLMNA